MNVLEGALATVADLAAYIGESISDEVEQKQAEALLAQASSLVRSEARQPTWGFNHEGKVPEAAFWVTLSCAARGYTNFEGFEYESVDDWRAGGRKVEEAGLFLTATERRTLQELRPARGPLRTVSTFRDSHTMTGTNWTPVKGARSEFPW